MHSIKRSDLRLETEQPMPDNPLTDPELLRIIYGWKPIEPALRMVAVPGVSPQPQRPKYSCPQPNCSKDYYTMAGLRYHLKNFHNIHKKKALNCPHCTKTYNTQVGLKYHLNHVHAQKP
jgi:hypothetical protein